MEFTSWDVILQPDELAHFGTRGMKWGQRRYQNEDGSLTSLGKERYGHSGERSRLGIKHDLNKLDREQTNAKARYDYYHGKSTQAIARANKKIRKIEAKQPGSRAARAKAKEKIGKLKARIAKVEATSGKKAADYGKLLNKSRQMSERIIGKALKKGYSIKSRDCLRAVNKGRNAAVNVLANTAGIALAMTTGVHIAYGQSSYAPGKHYRVVNDGLGIRTHRSRRWGNKHNGL